MNPYLKALRPVQWAKNLVIAGPFLFVPEVWGDSHVWVRLALTITAFCGLSSSTYLINDLRDREADRHHPRKMHRPIASGTISPQVALGMAIALMCLGLGMMYAVDSMHLPDADAGLVLPMGICYLAMTLAYSLGLKELPILDVILVALGFVLRAAAGAAAVRVEASPWLLLCTFLLMLMIALGKRRWELVNLEYALAHRPNLREYNLTLLDQFLGVVASMTLMAYALYTFNSEHVEGSWLMLTIPNVLYGVIRYLALIHVNEEGGAPEEAILKDPATMINIGFWILLVSIIMRMFHVA